MNDLISREEARNLMYHKQESLTEYDLDSLPTIEAEIVRHGHWERGGYACGETEWCCSVCGHEEWRTGKTNYCPVCGAKMDIEWE